MSDWIMIDKILFNLTMCEFFLLPKTNKNKKQKNPTKQKSTK